MHQGVLDAIQALPRSGGKSGSGSGSGGKRGRSGGKTGKKPTRRPQTGSDPLGVGNESDTPLLSDEEVVSDQEDASADEPALKRPRVGGKSIPTAPVNPAEGEGDAAA